MASVSSTCCLKIRSWFRMAILICSLSMSRTSRAQPWCVVCVCFTRISASVTRSVLHAACKKRELRCDDPADRVSGTFRELFQAKQIYISRPYHSVGNKKKEISMKQKQGTIAEKAVSILCNCITSFQDLRHGTPRSESAISRTRTAKQRRPRRRSSGLCWEASRPAWPVISIYLSI